jgi:hypothetical protein
MITGTVNVDFEAIITLSVCSSNGTVYTQVDIAHPEFERSKNDQSWVWDQDPNSPNGASELLTRFGFAAYFLGKRKRVPFG